MTTRRLGKTTLALSLAATVAALASCAGPVEEEATGAVTSKQLAPYTAVKSPASVSADFVNALGGVPVDLDGWRGYVAGTIDEGDEDDALFAIHLSGVKGDDPVAGLTVALVEGDETSDDLEESLANARFLEVRFNNGSGLVARHDFESQTTRSKHEGDPASRALLERAFNDANAILQAPVEQSPDDDDSKACLANYLMTIQHAARCVDRSDPSDCAAVRGDAVNTAASCAGTKTANVLASLQGNKAGALRPQGIGDIFKGLFSLFFPIAQPGTPTATATAANNPIAALVRGLLASFAGASTTPFSSIFGTTGATTAPTAKKTTPTSKKATTTKTVPATKFKNPGTPTASKKTGGVTVKKKDPVPPLPEKKEAVPPLPEKKEAVPPLPEKKSLPEDSPSIDEIETIDI